MKTVRQISYYDFVISRNNFGHFAIYINLPEFNEDFGYFQQSFNSVEKINNILEKIEIAMKTSMLQIISGDQEAYLNVNRNLTEVVITLPGYTEYFINTDVIYAIFKEYKEFLFRYESCQIPGIIPESKLDEWIAVPKEFVKDEWWKKTGENEG